VEFDAAQRREEAQADRGRHARDVQRANGGEAGQTPAEARTAGAYIYIYDIYDIYTTYIYMYI